jgi:Mrp family chromosome partitioning ATPase
MPRDFAPHGVMGVTELARPPKVSGFDPVHGLLEQYRRLYLSLVDAVAPRSAVAICSPNHGDGRSTIAGNLAVVMAYDLDRPITIVDLDLRESALSRMFNLEPERGVCDMQDGDDIEDFLTPTRTPGLSLLATGELPANPVRFLNSDRLRRAIADLEARGHFVIVDTPSALRYVDASMVALATGSAVTVVKLCSTKKFQLAAYYRKLEGARFCGVVCNYDEYWIPGWLYRLA